MESRAAGVRVVGEAVSRLTQQAGAVPLLDPEKDLKVREIGPNNMSIDCCCAEDLQHKVVCKVTDTSFV